MTDSDQVSAAQMSNFVHLRLHSEFSITDGMTRGSDAISRAASEKMPALALTDLSNLFGIVKFYSAARKLGVKPIIGCDVYVENAGNTGNAERATRLLLLCKNRVGYLQLCEILSGANLAPRKNGRAEVSLEMLKNCGTSGLIALSGADFGDVGEALLKQNASQDNAEAKTRAQAWQAFFPNAFYLEIQRYKNTAEEENFINATLQLAAELDLPVVATHPIQFLDEADFLAHEARVCIAEGQMLADARRPKIFTAAQYFKSAEEMQALFADIPEALQNTLEIAKRCNVEIPLGKSFLPDFPTPNNESLNDFLRSESKRGLEARLLNFFPKVETREKERETYEKRLEIELNTIIEMGFPGYFLIVADFIFWSKNNGVPVGPGRGSGAGSLVAYSLGITDINPLPYALLFERFLNPERVSMPDFDIDFCQENRGRVIDYVRAKYGHAAVSQIATFGTMSSKAVIRDVGRVMEMSYSFCDKISKLIPVEANKPLSLKGAIAAEPQLQQMLDNEEGVSDLFELAKRLEDLARNVGMHAGGVLIAPGKLTDFCPLYSNDGGTSVISQFDKDDVEKAGLVKFDFLGLRNLTILALAVKYVESLEGLELILDTKDFTDEAAYQILKTANTTSIFQVESDGMKKLLKKLAPDRFEDIIAVLALYRPGPLGSGMVDDFILRKKGQQKIDYFHPDLQACLAPTYGVIVYQEQVMQIAQIIGGYTLGGADLLRRAMGKKDITEMARHRQIMADGAEKKGYDKTLATTLFDLMEKFAEYGFNKSHTAAYAVVTYQTAWLKAHHAAAFIAATLSSDMDNTDSVKICFDDAIANKINVLAPDVNASDYRFTPVDRSTIRYGLGAIKGTGEQAVLNIIEARKNGKFTDLFDFCLRVDKRLCNKRTVEGLIRAGAFDALNNNRRQLLASVSIAMEAADQAEQNAQQTSLFDLFSPEENASLALAYVESPPFSEREQLTEEKIAIGFYLSGHPYLIAEAETKTFVKSNLSALQPKREPQMLAGLVTAIRYKLGRRGKMAMIEITDGKVSQEIVAYSELLETQPNKIVEDEILVFEAKVQADEYAGEGRMRIVAENVLTLGETRARFAKFLAVSCGENTGKVAQKINAEELAEILKPFIGGSCPIRIFYQNKEGSCQLSLGKNWLVKPEENLIAALKNKLGNEQVKLHYN